MCLQKLSLWQQLREKFEASVPGTTLVNEGSIFLALGLWAAWQVRGVCNVFCDVLCF